MEWLIMLLLPLSAWSGWWLAMRKEAREMRLSKSRAAYFEGLSLLLNDQTERAVDVFLSMAEIDRQTFDNQLTLGALFRKRGELDRALHLHSRLAEIARPESSEHFAVQYELAEDYVHAGMFRQAQGIFEALADADYRNDAVYPALWRLYERTAQWEKAIHISQKWEAAGYGKRALQIAHYYCERADLALKDKAFDQAHHYLREALATDPRCGRASLMQAELAMQNDEPVSAIHHYHAIAEQAENFLPDILPMLAAAYQKIGREEEYLHWLLTREASLQQVRLTRATAQAIAEMNLSAARQLLKERLEETHNPLLLHDYLSYAERDVPEGQALFQLGQTLGKALLPTQGYQCNECGFRQQRMIWHCPACHAWSSFHPLIELKREQR